MKARVRFSKQGNMKFIGHLDVMRYFQKAIRRAGLDVAFTEGFNPHMIMSFASPLGIGLTSDAEYMDIELRTPISSKDAIEALNRVSAEGITVTGFVQIPEGKADKAMSLVAAADYTIRFRNGHEPEPGFWKNRKSEIADFFARETIPVLKKTKRSEKEVDIRSMIYGWSIGSGSLSSLCSEENPPEEADFLFLRLAAGSVDNLKPELVMDTLLSSVGFDLDPLAYEINRCEIYADTRAEGHRCLVPLYDLGMEIPACQSKRAEGLRLCEG